ncbi:TetR family transcriptional regulator [Streptomyces sp. HNM0575]|uniref:TetR/AcrR family transcriptional regulator n=1 Tax=Streptomyces sp. HNM0575 TaxID=2716338 RepID=UPI00145D1265|nr:TetR family transcriptional regulator [Streptomyces sp. HNM0575]NLU76054.1 TetR family transcriptional regulator [Streptomyces sp. HNM0575]
MKPNGGGSEPPAESLRERKKAQTRRSIQEHALRLFLDQGYESTTVEDIAAAADVSHMTFFRYFPTKESVVESDDYDPLITRLIEERPLEEDPLTALQQALAQGLAGIYEADKQALLVRTRLIRNAPALRARLWQNQYATEQLFRDALMARRPDDDSLRVRVLAAASLAALTTALTVWADGEGRDHLPTLVDRAFEALRAQSVDERRSHVSGR